MGTLATLLLAALVTYLGFYGARGIYRHSDHDDSLMLFVLITAVGLLLFGFTIVRAVWPDNPFLAVCLALLFISFGFAIDPLKRKLDKNAKQRSKASSKY